MYGCGVFAMRLEMHGRMLEKKGGGAAVYIVNAIRPGDSVFSQSGGMNSRNGRV